MPGFAICCCSQKQSKSAGLSSHSRSFPLFCQGPDCCSGRSGNKLNVQECSRSRDSLSKTEREREVLTCLQWGWSWHSKQYNLLPLSHSILIPCGTTTATAEHDTLSTASPTQTLYTSLLQSLATSRLIALHQDYH